MKTEKPVGRSVVFPERPGGYFWLHVSSTTGGAFDSAPCCAGMMTAVAFIPEDVSRRFYVICAAVHWCRDADDGNSCLIFINLFSVYRASSATRKLCRNDRAILA